MVTVTAPTRPRCTARAKASVPSRPKAATPHASGSTTRPLSSASQPSGSDTEGTGTARTHTASQENAQPQSTACSRPPPRRSRDPNHTRPTASATAAATTSPTVGGRDASGPAVQAIPVSAATATATATASRRRGRCPSSGQASSTVTASEVASSDCTRNSGSTRIASTEATQATRSAARPATYHGLATTPRPSTSRAVRACTTEAAP